MKCTQIKCGATQIGKHHHNAKEKRTLQIFLDIAKIANLRHYSKGTTTSSPQSSVTVIAKGF